VSPLFFRQSFIPWLIFFLSTSAGARIFYVSPSGSDQNLGTREKPLASPGYASRRLEPGDTLLISGGRYRLSRFDEDIVMPKSGKAGAWITIRGEAGNRPILAGADNLFAGVILGGCSYIRLEFLEITHDPAAAGSSTYFRDGVHIVGESPSRHIILKDLYIHHLDEFGLDAQDADSMEVLGCRIEYCGFGAMGGPSPVHGGWKHVRVEGCRLAYSWHYYRGGNGSSRPYDRPDGFGIEASDGPVEIVRTTSEHNFGDGLDSKASSTSIRQCIVADNSCDGVKLWGGNSLVENTLIYGRGDGNPTPTPWAAVVIGTEQAGTRFALQNVTVDDSLGGNYLMYAQYDETDTPIRLDMRNCIFSGRGTNCPIFVRGTVSLACENNLFFMPNQSPILIYGEKDYSESNMADLGKGNLYGDPEFIRPAWGDDGDYHLDEGSPALDSGDPLHAPSMDLEGQDRPVGKGVDLGCYESDLTPVADSADPPDASGFTLEPNFPNPFNAVTTIRYSLPSPCTIRLAVFDVTGRQAALLADGRRPEGEHRATFDGNSLNSGMYFCRLQAGQTVLTRKMVFLK
jgi:hypothetical protein